MLISTVSLISDITVGMSTQLNAKHKFVFAKSCGSLNEVIPL